MFFVCLFLFDFTMVYIIDIHRLDTETDLCAYTAVYTFIFVNISIIHTIYTV